MKKYFLILVALIVGLVGLGMWGQKIGWLSFFAKEKNNYRMTVFVHGSFGTMLGFLSFGEVLQDKVTGTAYRDLNKKMRMDDYFFKDQPILQRGLINFKPTLNPVETNHKFYAVYPIAAAYDCLQKQSQKTNESELYYTFGWTGLISQNSRRHEAIRFYNALAQELDRLKKEGINPRIRLVAHSHGGNLCLNLAAVKAVARLAKLDERQILSGDQDEQDALISMVKHFGALQTQSDAAQQPDQKAFDYVPTNKELFIDELIMLGTPIQPETEMFAYNQIFGTVFNIYSDEDFIQQADWVSSKKGISQKLITKKPLTTPHARIVQIKLTQRVAQKELSKDQAVESGNLFEQLISGNLIKRNTSDPTHKELWFADWSDEKKEFKTLLSPLPAVVIVPLMLAQLDSTVKNLEFIMTTTYDNFVLKGTCSDTKKSLSTKTVPLLVLNELKKKFETWRPQSTDSTKEFEAIYKHLLGYAGHENIRRA